MARCRLACYVPALTDAMEKSAALCPDCREGHNRPAGQMTVQDPVAPSTTPEQDRLVQKLILPLHLALLLYEKGI